jgi:hypothetical protein
LLNLQQVIEEIKEKTEWFLEFNENKNTTDQSL